MASLTASRRLFSPKLVPTREMEAAATVAAPGDDICTAKRNS
jgi:hypothetical protein